MYLSSNISYFELIYLKYFLPDCFPHLDLNLPGDSGAAMNIFKTVSFQCDCFVKMWQFQAYQNGTVFIGTLEPLVGSAGTELYRLTSKTRFDVEGTGIYNHTFAVEDMIRVKTGDVIATIYVTKGIPGVIPYADSRSLHSMGAYIKSDLSTVSQHINTHESDLNVGDSIITNTASFKRLPAIRAYTVQ